MHTSPDSVIGAADRQLVVSCDPKHPTSANSALFFPIDRSRRNRIPARHLFDKGFIHSLRIRELRTDDHARAPEAQQVLARSSGIGPVAIHNEEI